MIGPYCDWTVTIILFGVKLTILCFLSGVIIGVVFGVIVLVVMVTLVVTCYFCKRYVANVYVIML